MKTYFYQVWVPTEYVCVRKNAVSDVNNTEDEVVRGTTRGCYTTTKHGSLRQLCGNGRVLSAVFTTTSRRLKVVYKSTSMGKG